MRYYVTYYSRLSEFDSVHHMFRPAESVRIGRLDRVHQFLSSRNGNDYGKAITLNTIVYPSLADAWSACKELCQLQNLVLADNMTDDDRQYISSDINSNLDRFFALKNTKNMYNAYVSFHEKKAMCDYNNLLVDGDGTSSKMLSDQYADYLGNPDAHDQFFSNQATMFASSSRRFSSETIESMMEPNLDEDQFLTQMENLYKTAFSELSDSVKLDIQYISPSDITIESILYDEMSDDVESPSYSVDAKYNGKLYSIKSNAKNERLMKQQLANTILRNIQNQKTVSVDKQRDLSDFGKFDGRQYDGLTDYGL